MLLKYRTQILALILGFAVFAGLYHQAMFSPNSYLFGSSGDGVKNYYTYAYQVQNGDEFTHFDGMNYPYAENALFTDNHFALGLVLNKLGVEQNLVGILNLLMLLGPVFCCLFLVLILRRFKVPDFIALLGAISITILAPQIFRLEGHYALSYSFVIPLCWYLFIRFWDSENRKWLWTLILTLNSTFWVFIHPYYGLLIGLFFGCFWVLYLLRNRKELLRFSNYIQLFAHTIVPLIVVSSVLSSTDTHTNRNNNPYGFLAYHAEAETVFVPSHAPLKPLIDKVVYIDEQIWEGWAYIGLTSILVIAISMVYIFVNRTRKYRERIHALFDREMGVYIFTGILLLIFAMGYPFRLNLLWLLDSIPGLGQFRSVGRFAWIFYFVITVFSVRAMSIYAHQLMLKQRRIAAYALIFIGLGLYVVEGIPHHLEMRGKIVQSPNLFDHSQLDGSTQNLLAAIEIDKFQAILPIPFFHLGSEIYTQNGSDASMRTAQVISFHTKLPMISSALGRTSIDEAKSLIQLADMMPYEKPILSELDLDKPVLLLVAASEIPAVNASYKSQEIYRDSAFALYELDLHLMNQETLKNEFLSQMQTNLKLYKDSIIPDLISVKHQNFIVRDFDENAGTAAFSGTGSLQLPSPEGYTELLSFEAKTLKLDTEYIISFWYRLDQEGFPPAVVASQNNLYQEVKVQHQAFSDEVKSGQNFYGDWIRIEFPITISSLDDPVHVAVCNIRKGHQQATIDNFMVRRADDIILQKSRQELWYNNHRIKLSQ